MNTNVWYQRLLSWGLYALLFTPLIVSNSLFFPFITGKNFFFRIVVEILAALWILRCVQDHKARPRRGILFWLVLGLTIAVLISTFFGIDPYRSFWSNFERMEGAVTYIHLLLYFVVLISTLTSLQSWRRLWQVNLGVNMLVAVVALSQIFGWYEVHQGSVRLDATLGNATYLAVYMLFGVFYTLFLWLESARPIARRYLYPLCVIIQLFVLYKTATRGAILGLLIGVLVAAILFILKGGKEYSKLRRVAGIGIACVVLIVAVFFAARNGSFVQKSPVLSRFANISLSERTTESRLIIWRMSLRGAAERPLFGWGPENYSVVFNKYYDPRLWRQEPWFDRSHNVLIDWLVMTGIVGIALYLSLYIAGLIKLWSRKATFSLPERALLTGLLCAYLFQNIFVFDNLISLMLFVATLGFIHARTSENHLPVGVRWRGISVPAWGKGIIVIITITILYVVNVRPIIASRNIIQALSPQKGGITDNLEIFKKISQADTLAGPEAALQFIAFSQNVLSQPTVPDDLRQSIGQATVDMVESEINKHPTDARLVLIYATFLSRQGQYEKAEIYLKKALGLTPRKQSVAFELAAIELEKNRVQEGMAILKQAFESDPNYLDARKMYALGAFAVNNKTLANDIMSEVYGSSAVPDRRFAVWYVSMGNYRRAIESLENIIKENESGLSDNDAFLLAGLYVQAGNRDKALATLNALKSKNASLTETIDKLTAAIQAGLNPFEIE